MEFNLKYIEKSVSEIAEAAHDDEAAHSMEDTLYQEAIEFVADGGVLTQEMAKSILKTYEIDFYRWYA